MTEQLIHIKQEQINRDDLDMVITGLEIACGGNRIQVAETFDLVVTDERQAIALKALFGSNGKKKQEKKGRTVLQKKPAAQGAHSYRFEDTGEVISKQAINKRLAAREITPGTAFLDAEGEKYLVVQSEYPGGPYRLVNAGQWKAEQETGGAA